MVNFLPGLAAADDPDLKIAASRKTRLSRTDTGRSSEKFLSISGQLKSTSNTFPAWLNTCQQLSCYLKDTKPKSTVLNALNIFVICGYVYAYIFF